MNNDIEIVSAPNSPLCDSAHFMLLWFSCSFQNNEMAAILTFQFYIPWIEFKNYNPRNLLSNMLNLILPLIVKKIGGGGG